MDPVTHLVTGVLGERMAGPWFREDDAPVPRTLLPFCLIASVLPDMDNFFGGGDPEQYLLLHRGLTHSILGSLAAAVVFALLYKCLFRRLPLLKLTATACALAPVHLFLDLITSYGTQLLAPFSDARFSLGSVFIIDPFFTLVLAGTAVFTYLLPAKRVIFAGLGLFWLIAYPMTNLSMKYTLESLYAAQLHSKNRTFQEVKFEPDAFTPLYWKVVVKKNEGWDLTEVKLFSPDKFQTLSFAAADPKLLEQLGEQASIFRTWEWFSVYPHQTVTPEKDGRSITFGDLRFTSVHPIMQAVFGDRRSPFTLTARLDAQGNLTGYTWHNGREALVYALE